MFQGLDDINWGSLTHAYGAASDVPKLIRDLMGEDSLIVEEALNELFANIWHQGTVYEATAHVVPFLVEALERRQTHQRDIVLLIECIANGRGYYQVHADLKIHGGKTLVPPTDEVRVQLEIEDRIVRCTHLAVWSYTDVFIGLMNDPAVELRRHLPSLLSSVPEGKNWLLANSVSRLEFEPDLFAKVNLLLALARCCDSRKDIAEDLMRLPASNELLMEWAKAFPLMVAGGSHCIDSESAAEAVLLPWK